MAGECWTEFALGVGVDAFVVVVVVGGVVVIGAVVVDPVVVGGASTVVETGGAAALAAVVVGFGFGVFGIGTTDASTSVPATGWWSPLPLSGR